MLLSSGNLINLCMYNIENEKEYYTYLGQKTPKAWGITILENESCMCLLTFYFKHEQIRLVSYYAKMSCKHSFIIHVT